MSITTKTPVFTVDPKLRLKGGKVPYHCILRNGIFFKSAPREEVLETASELNAVNYLLDLTLPMVIKTDKAHKLFNRATDSYDTATQHKVDVYLPIKMKGQIFHSLVTIKVTEADPKKYNLTCCGKDWYTLGQTNCIHNGVDSVAIAPAYDEGDIFKVGDHTFQVQKPYWSNCQDHKYLEQI